MRFHFLKVIFLFYLYRLLFEIIQISVRHFKKFGSWTKWFLTVSMFCAVILIDHFVHYGAVIENFNVDALFFSFLVISSKIPPISHRSRFWKSIYFNPTNSVIFFMTAGFIINEINDFLDELTVVPATLVEGIVGILFLLLLTTTEIDFFGDLDDEHDVTEFFKKHAEGFYIIDGMKSVAIYLDPSIKFYAFVPSPEKIPPEMMDNAVSWSKIAAQDLPTSVWKEACDSESTVNWCSHVSKDIAESAAKMELINRDRHCAYCLKFLPAGTAKLCGKCHRRAYCSRECQEADWEDPQFHKYWCHLGCGEEDIDWEIKPVDGKGLGMVAKRFIPVNYRIIVDTPHDHNHPAIADLSPIGGTREEKIQRNSFSGGSSGLPFGNNIKESQVYLRVSRINHDCDPNAARLFERDKDGRTVWMIVFSTRDIQEGEEITISYTLFTSVLEDLEENPNIESLAKNRENLERNWGIKCPDDCFCRTVGLEDRLVRYKGMGRKLNSVLAFDSEEDLEAHNESRRQVKRLFGVGSGEMMEMLNSKNARYYYSMAKELLENLDTIRGSWNTQLNALYIAFQIGISRRETMNEGISFVKRMEEMLNPVCHPNATCMCQYRSWIADPSHHGKYLLAEKRLLADSVGLRENVMIVMNLQK